MKLICQDNPQEKKIWNAPSQKARQQNKTETKWQSCSGPEFAFSLQSDLCHFFHTLKLCTLKKESLSEFVIF